MDETRFRQFYEETSPALAAYVRRVVGDAAASEDILQEAYFRMLRTAPKNLNPTERRKYVYRVATNLVRDRARRERRVHEQLTDDVVDPAAGVELPNESGEALHSALAALTGRGRQLLWLAYVDEYSHRAMAVITGLNEASIAPMLYRARRALAAELRRRGDHR